MTNKLNDLLTKNYDAEAGYKKAAKIVDNPKLKQFFETQAKNRYDFGHQLKTEINSVGGSPDKGTSVTGDAHRAWMTIKDTFTPSDEEAILEEVIRGEKTAVSEYKEILTEAALPPTTKSIITDQIESVENALRNTKNFEVMYS